MIDFMLNFLMDFRWIFDGFRYGFYDGIDGLLMRCDVV